MMKSQNCHCSVYCFRNLSLRCQILFALRLRRHHCQHLQTYLRGVNCASVARRLMPDLVRCWDVARRSAWRPLRVSLVTEALLPDYANYRQLRQPKTTYELAAAWQQNESTCLHAMTSLASLLLVCGAIIL